jgi:hypothetical protein
MALSFVDSLQRGSESPELVVVRRLFRLVRGNARNNETMWRAYRKRYGVGGAVSSQVRLPIRRSALNLVR